MGRHESQTQHWIHADPAEWQHLPQRSQGGQTILLAIYFQFSAWPVVFSTCGDSTCALQVHLVLLVLVFD